MQQKKILSIDAWTARADQHIESVSIYTESYLNRRYRKEEHPVHDFLFTYYNCSPQKLKQWIPSFEENLMITPSIKEKYPWFTEQWFTVNGNVIEMKGGNIRENTLGLSKFVTELCENILKRAPRLGCFGLHEWAMVYQSSLENLRHPKHPLRLSMNEIGRFLESQKLCCTHYDAYRFFTEEAKPLNIFTPILETRLQMEQGGCVHANMDLYKWSTKFWPWIGSDFIAETFFLALEARELDMRASPYDLQKKGYLPICVETEEGRLQYQQHQQALAEKAVPLRKKLKNFCSRLID
jgi:hypothetical protein